MLLVTVEFINGNCCTTVVLDLYAITKQLNHIHSVKPRIFLNSTKCHCTINEQFYLCSIVVYNILTRRNQISSFILTNTTQTISKSIFICDKRVVSWQCQRISMRKADKFKPQHSLAYFIFNSNTILFLVP